MAEPTIIIPVDDTTSVAATRPGPDGMADVLIGTPGGTETSLTGQADDLAGILRQALADLGDDDTTARFMPTYPLAMRAGWWIDSEAFGRPAVLAADPEPCGGPAGECVLLVMRSRQERKEVHVNPNDVVMAHPPLPRPSLDEARGMADEVMMIAEGLASFHDGDAQ